MTDAIKRLMEFVTVNGGISTVAKKAGLTDSVFNNYKNPKRKNENVGGEVHVKMKMAFPETYSADYIITGEDEIAKLRNELLNEKLERIKLQEFFIQKEMALSNFK
jgi:hypothetical protein